MTIDKSMLRPTFEPAKSIYDAFLNEADKRKGRTIEESIHAERQAVWRAARDAAQQHGLRVPTMEEVEACERVACGHVDYGSKWAYGVVQKMRSD